MSKTAKPTEKSQKSQKSYSDVFKAVNKHDLPTLKRFIDASVDVNTCNETGETILHVATRRGFLSIFKLVLTTNINVNAQNNEGQTVLHYAAGYRHFDMIRLLISHGANVNLQNKWGHSAIFGLINGGFSISMLDSCFNAIKLFIDNGADVNIQSADYGDTILHDAIGCGYLGGKASLDLIQLLVDCGVDISIQNKYGMNALTYALGYHNWDIIDILIDAIKDPSLITAIDIYGNNALHHIISSDGESPNLIKMFLDKGVNINWRNNEGQTPLHRAVRFGYARLVSLFKHEGADMTIRDNDGKTAFELATKYNEINVLNAFRDIPVSATYDDHWMSFTIPMCP